MPREDTECLEIRIQRSKLDRIYQYYVSKGDIPAVKSRASLLRRCVENELQRIQFEESTQSSPETGELVMNPDIAKSKAKILAALEKLEALEED